MRKIIIDEAGEGEGGDEFNISEILKLLKEIKQLQQTAGSLGIGRQLIQQEQTNQNNNNTNNNISEDKLTATIDSLLNELKGNKLLADMKFSDVLKLAEANKGQLKEKIKQIVNYIIS